MKYLAIHFSNEYLNKYRTLLDITNNNLMIKKLPFYNENNVTNEAPTWIAYINGILNLKLYVHIVFNLNATISFIKNSNPEFIFFSADEINVDDIKSLIKNIKLLNIQSKFIIGNRNLKFSNDVTIINTIEEFNKMFNLNKLFLPSFKNTTFYSNYLPRIQITDGCSNHCKFCTINHNVTIKSVYDIEKQYVMYDGSSSYIYIGDATFGQKGDDEVNSLHNGYKYIVQTTVDEVLNNKNIINWKNMGVEYIELGVETFNDKTLKYINKNFNSSEAIQAIKFLKSMGFKIIINLMTGIKGEYKKEYDNTIKVVNTIKDYISHLNIYFYTDYKSKTKIDRKEVNIIKSWHKTETDKIDVMEFASKLFKINYELLNKNY